MIGTFSETLRPARADYPLSLQEYSPRGLAETETAQLEAIKEASHIEDHTSPTCACALKGVAIEQ